MTEVNSMCYRDFRYIKAIICIMITACMVSACSPELFTYKGDKITQKNLKALLKEGDQNGVWKTNELSITYQYQMTPETLKISGTTELLGGLATGFDQIKQLAVYLLFLDNQGVVIESALVYSTANNRTVDEIPMVFEKSIPIPDGARTISFVYNGELTGLGGSYSIGLSTYRP
jgi:hypothetical protein